VASNVDKNVMLTNRAETASIIFSRGNEALVSSDWNVHADTRYMPLSRIFLFLAFPISCEQSIIDRKTYDSSDKRKEIQVDGSMREEFSRVEGPVNHSPSTHATRHIQKFYIIL
jgi:hypothetical protein